MEHELEVKAHLHNINSVLIDLKNGQVRQDEKIEALCGALSTIAAQNERLNIQSAQINEARGDINHMEKRIQELAEWKASCPRVAFNDQLREIRGWIIALTCGVGSVLILIGGSFTVHILGGK